MEVATSGGPTRGGKECGALMGQETVTQGIGRTQVCPQTA
jgi:hypothetical protein